MARKKIQAETVATSREPMKTTVAVKTEEPVAVEAKPEPAPAPFVPLGAHLPSHYSEDRLVVMARDPMWLHCYWELEGGGVNRLPETTENGSWVLRVTPWGRAPYDVEIDPSARNWYLSVMPYTRYRIELGLRSGQGQFHGVVTGNEVVTAPSQPGMTAEESWRQFQDEMQAMKEQRYLGASGGMSGAFVNAVASSRASRRAGRRSPRSRQTGVKGYMMLVLHAHLPFVRHPEHERFLEEDWLFEAVIETYIPLAMMLMGLDDRGVHARMTMTISPPLCEMLADPLLRQRCGAHIDRLQRTVEDLARTYRGTPFQSAADMYLTRLSDIRDFYRSLNGDVLQAFRDLESRGVLEIITSAATHGLLPLMRHEEAMRAQIETACKAHEKHFGHRPDGIWLPECAYRSRLDTLLKASGLRYFYLDSHGLLNGTPQPKYLTYRPVITPSGVAAFARDVETGVQVWSAESGYPGDPCYREFYRDQGYDADIDLVRNSLHPDGVRRSIGLKFHRITGKVQLHEKEPYVPDWAQNVVRTHAKHFAEDTTLRIEGLASQLGTRPVICAMYDAELFGHWWYEGIDFLGHVFENIGNDISEVEPITPSEFLERENRLQMVRPSSSSWGDKGYFGHWLNGTNDWVYPHLHKAEDRMVELARRFTRTEGLTRRALNQAARELMLAQSSDWAFLIATRTAPAYATRRTRDHIAQFTALYEQLMSGAVNESSLADLEHRDSIFQELDYRVYS